MATLRGRRSRNHDERYQHKHQNDNDHHRNTIARNTIAIATPSSSLFVEPGAACNREPELQRRHLTGGTDIETNVEVGWSRMQRCRGRRYTGAVLKQGPYSYTPNSRQND